MSKLNDLIKELCPDGVEYKKINEVFTLHNGMTGVSNKWKNSGNCKFIDYLNAYKNFKIDTTKTPYATVKNLKQNELQTGDILLTSASEKPNECAISSVIADSIEKGIFLDDHLFCIRVKEEYIDKINPVFVNYYMKTPEFRTKITKAVRGVTRFYISTETFMELQIPIPPLPIQEEIVRILDKFEKLETELAAELAARKKQYEFYRNQLLSFDTPPAYLRKLIKECLKGEIKKVRLGDVCEISDGFPFNTTDIKESGKYPIIKITNIQNKAIVPEKSFCNDIPLKIKKEHKLCGGEILIAMSGATCGKAGYNILSDALVNQRVAIVRNSEKINNLYLKHIILNDKFYNYLQSKGTGTQKNISKTDIANYSIDLPPLEIQNRIVEILDNFDKICNDLQIGLPKEIELRNKQYEFYRNSLLNFSSIEDLTTHTHTHTHTQQIVDLWKIIYYVLGVKKYELKDICDVGTGSSNRVDADENGVYNFYVRSKDVLKSNSYEFDEEAILIPGEGGIGEIFHYINGKYALHQRAYRVHPTNTLLNGKFLFYYMRNHFGNFITKKSVGSTVTSIRKPMIENFKITISPLFIQQKIVEVLDKFEEISNDAQKGLQLNIEQEHKRYEYYRNKLLAFKEKVN